MDPPMATPRGGQIPQRRQESKLLQQLALLRWNLLQVPLPHPSFGELLYKLDLLRADTRRSMVEWERKMAELRTAHNSIIDNVGRETNEIISELREIILSQEAEDIQSRRRALQEN